MGYQKHNFKSGDVLTAKIMNEIEQGIVDASSAQTNLELTKTINNVKAVFAGLQQKNIFAVAEIENTAEKRQTADGATNGITVLDGSYATVKKIQGKTVASKNLVNIPQTGLWGATYKQLWSGSLSGDFVASWETTFNLAENENALLEFVVNGKSVYGGYEPNYKKFSGTLTEIYLYNNGEGVGTLSNFMLNYGSTVEPYVPYFDGLKHAQISGIKSTGRNLFNPNRTVVEDFGDASASTVRNFIPNSIIKGISFANDYYKDGVEDFSFKNGVLSFISNTSGYGVGFNFDCDAGEEYWFTFQKEGEYGTSVAFYKDGVFMSGQPFSYTFTTPEGCNQFVIKLETAVGSKATFYDLQLERDRATDYIPYTESVMDLFETIELGEWDSIENGKFIKRTGTLALTGEEAWYISGERYTTSAIDSLAKDGQVVIALGFEYGEVSTATGGGKLVFTVNKELYPTIGDWQNYLIQQNSNDTPITIAFELANPFTPPLASAVDFKYQVWDKGQEIMQVENTDAIPTITADYYILGGTTE